MKKLLRLISFTFPLAIVFCLLGQMVVANQMIVLSTQLGQIDRRIDELSDQNDFLNKRLTENLSVQRVANQAKLEGFIDATSYIAFDGDSFPVAIKR